MNAYYYELLSNKFHYLLECFGISISLRSRKNLCVVCGVLASLLMNHGLMLESRVSVPFASRAIIARFHFFSCGRMAAIRYKIT
jgi:hypothetical protein